MVRKLQLKDLSADGCSEMHQTASKDESEVKSDSWFWDALTRPPYIKDAVALQVREIPSGVYAELNFAKAKLKSHF